MISDERAPRANTQDNAGLAGDESQDMALPQTRLGALKAREGSMQTIGNRPAGMLP